MATLSNLFKNCAMGTFTSGTYGSVRESDIESVKSKDEYRWTKYPPEIRSILVDLSHIFKVSMTSIRYQDYEWNINFHSEFRIRVRKYTQVLVEAKEYLGWAVDMLSEFGYECKLETGCRLVILSSPNLGIPRLNSGKWSLEVEDSSLLSELRPWIKLK